MIAALDPAVASLLGVIGVAVIGGPLLHWLGSRADRNNLLSIAWEENRKRTEERDAATDRVHELERERIEKDDQLRRLQHQHEQCPVLIQNLEHAVDQMRRDRDHYRELHYRRGEQP